MIADDNAGRGKSFARDVLKLQSAERHAFNHAARHPAGGAAQAVGRRTRRNDFQDGPQHVVEKYLAAAQVEDDPERHERMPPARGAARRILKQQQIHAQRRQNQRGHEGETHAEQHRHAHREQHRMIRNHQHPETKNCRERRDQYGGAGGSGKLRLPAPCIQLARQQEHAVILADADDEDDEYAVHQINGHAQPAHDAERPQQPKGQWQQRDHDQFGRAQGQKKKRRHHDAGPQRKVSESAFRQPGDVIGEGFVVEDDHFRQRRPELSRAGAILQFDHRTHRVVVRAERDPLVQRLLQRRAPKHLQRQ